jgi:hypothetical protein
MNHRLDATWPDSTPGCSRYQQLASREIQFRKRCPQGRIE